MASLDTATVTLSLPRKSTPFCADLRRKLDAKCPALGVSLRIQKFESFVPARQSSLVVRIPGVENRQHFTGLATICAAKGGALV
jgi:hypothetical protein